MRVSAQLIEAETGAHLWAEREFEDIFKLQDEITLSVVGAIEPNLREAEIERVKRKRPDSLDAYDLVLRAIPLLTPRCPKRLSRASRYWRGRLRCRPTTPAPTVCSRGAMRLCSCAGHSEENRVAAIRHAPCSPCSWSGRRHGSGARRVRHRDGGARSSHCFPGVRTGTRAQPFFRFDAPGGCRCIGLWRRGRARASSQPCSRPRELLLAGGLQLAVANAAGGSAGASVTTAVSFGSQLPPNYSVFVDSGQSGVVGTVTARTSTGFNVALSPILTTTTVAAGTFNVLVLG